MEAKIFEIIGKLIIYVFTGIGISIFTLWAISKFLTYAMKTFKVWKLFVDFVFDYKQFKQWKNGNEKN